MQHLNTGLLFFFSLVLSAALQAQSGCPGCKVVLPANMPADTIFLPKIPSGEVGKDYDQDISFRMPKTTTAVSKIDSTTPPGLTISKIEILSVEGLPPGLRWQANQSVFEVGSQTDGCIKICGTPITSDSFVLIVRLKASILFLNRESSFPMRLYIAPKVSTNDGFSMTNFKDCGSAKVSFKNNNPSNGKSGFTYEWDLGDGSPVFKGENPPPHLYNKPGQYIVKYKARIDTAQAIFKNIDVLKVNCVDQLGLGAPDLYVLIFDPQGKEIYNSSPYVDNTPLPYTWSPKIKLGPGNYRVAVWDEDAGLKGGDDPCGEISFNALSNGKLVASGFEVALDIQRPIIEVLSQDTVTVLPALPKPTLTAPNGLKECGNLPPVVFLSSSAAKNNQWILNGKAIPGETDQILDPKQSGIYRVQVIDPQSGCVSISDSLKVAIFPQPMPPAFSNNKNLLVLADTSGLPSKYTLQWYDGTDIIPGATGKRFCATKTGDYGLLLTDTETGCTSFYTSTVIHNPAFDCTVGADEVAVSTFVVTPNPATEWVVITLAQPTQNTALVRAFDLSGRLVENRFVAASDTQIQVDVALWPRGMYLIEVIDGAKKGIAKLVLH